MIVYSSLPPVRWLSPSTSSSLTWVAVRRAGQSDRRSGPREALLSDNINTFAAYAHGPAHTWILHLAPGWSPRGQWQHPYTLSKLFVSLCYAHDKNAIIDISPLCFANLHKGISGPSAIRDYIQDMSALGRLGAEIVIDPHWWIPGQAHSQKLQLETVVSSLQQRDMRATVLLQTDGYRQARALFPYVRTHPWLAGVLVRSGD